MKGEMARGIFIKDDRLLIYIFRRAEDKKGAKHKPGQQGDDHLPERR